MRRWMAGVLLAGTIIYYPAPVPMPLICTTSGGVTVCQ